jgi:hypothetical protein
MGANRKCESEVGQGARPTKDNVFFPRSQGSQPCEIYLIKDKERLCFKRSLR